MDIISQVNLECGLRFKFTAKFLSWLHFEKYFLLPVLSSGLKLTFERFQTVLNDPTKLPHFVERQKGSAFRKAKQRYKSELKQYWKATCANTNFRVEWTAQQGFQVVSNTSNWRRLANGLTSYQVCLTSDAYCALKGKYNSLYYDGKQAYILYGPLQYVNHSCSSTLSIARDGHRTDHAFPLHYEYAGDPYGGIGPVSAGEEVRVRYNTRSNLGFVCTCPSCK